MIPVVTVTDYASARVIVRALADEWDRQRKSADTEQDATVFGLLVSVAAQAEALGVDTSRYLTDDVSAIVAREVASTVPFTPVY